MQPRNNTLGLSILCAAGLLLSQAAIAGDGCSELGLGDSRQAIHSALEQALASSRGAGQNGGLGNQMWGTLVDKDGIVCAVAFTGANRLTQWPGSRVISVQKAFTAASFNLPAGTGGTVDALSTANLWTQSQPGGSLFGLQFSNPVESAVAYGNPSVAGGQARAYGTPTDPLVGRIPGGVNVFGGGLALYDASGAKVGAIGVSGDTSCADHNIAWRTRHALNLDFLTTAGVTGLSAAPRQDNIIYDIDPGNPHQAVNSSGGFGHPVCGFGEDAVAPTLPETQ